MIAIKEQDMLVALEDARPSETVALLAMSPADVREIGNGRSRMTCEDDEEEEWETHPAQ